MKFILWDINIFLGVGESHIQIFLQQWNESFTEGVARVWEKSYWLTSWTFGECDDVDTYSHLWKIMIIYVSGDAW